MSVDVAVSNGVDHLLPPTTTVTQTSATAAPTLPRHGADERDLGLTSTPAALLPPHPPASQSLPLPPTPPPAPSAASAPPPGEGGVALVGVNMGGHAAPQNGSTATLGPTSRAGSFMSKKRLGQVANGGVNAQANNNAATPFYPLAANGQQPPPGSTFPALHLHPLSDTFIPKQVSLAPVGMKVKIGRQTNAKTTPNSTNGYFDSKVLSRAHAEVWSEEGRVWIKDVKSSNGTFINGERLSPEGVESEAFELHNDDVVEFGIDIVSEDNKTIVHHKVAAKVFLVLTAEDAAASSREFASYYRSVGDGGMHRRPSRPGAFAGGSFDHVLNRLQTELDKSRLTGNELGTLNATMNDIHDTLNGGAGPPPPLPPPYQPGRAQINPLTGRPGPLPDPHVHTFAAVQSQLAETQASLATHVEKIRSLEGLLAAHEVMKREVGDLRTQMEESKREVDSLVRSRHVPNFGDGERNGQGGGRVSPVAAMLAAQEDDDMDDSMSDASMDTITWDSEMMTKKKRSLALPNGVHQIPIDSHMHSHQDRPVTPDELAHTTNEDHVRLVEQNATLTSKLESLSADLDDATKLGQALQLQHAEAAVLIRTLEERVQGLEKEVVKAETVENQRDKSVMIEPEQQQHIEHKWEGWRKQFEESWSRERQSWEEEREKLLGVIRSWESTGSSESEGEVEVTGACSGDRSIVTKGKGKVKSRRRRRTLSSSSLNHVPTERKEESVVEKKEKSLRPTTAVTSRRFEHISVTEGGKRGGGRGSDSDSTAVIGSGSTEDLSRKQRATSSTRSSGRKSALAPLIDPSHLPFISAAGVILVGIAAFSMVNKVKD